MKYAAILAALALVGCNGRSPTEPIEPKPTATWATTLSGSVWIRPTHGAAYPASRLRITAEQFGICHTEIISPAGNYRFPDSLQTGKAFVSIAGPKGYAPVLESIELHDGANVMDFELREKP